MSGLPHLKPSLFSLHYTSENVSMLPAIVTTVEMTVLALLISVPLGLFTAVYLNEYAKRGNKLVSIIRVTTETLSGIPSIVYGLFGMLFFVTQLHWGYSLIAGAMTLAIMILPLIMRTAEEALMRASCRASSSPSAASSAKPPRLSSPPAPWRRFPALPSPAARSPFICTCSRARRCT